MERKAITNGNGKWFDIEKAICYPELTYHNGKNYISKITGSQWEHEAMYKTASGHYIHNKYSDYQGSVETYIVVTKEVAAEWFAQQEYDMEIVPKELHQLINDFEI
ncbi:MAG TPA: hypothetical protein VFC79_06405 [Tissierellaceae bacterium]|nr:hypothetical protein [Tissierellaceae bacterium]